MLFAHLSHAAQPTEEAKARQLWQLLDYIAVDYAGAVSGGAVVSEAEYAEMIEFAQNSVKHAAALPPHPSLAQLQALIQRLQNAVQAKTEPSAVATLARDANVLLLKAYPIPVAPRTVPDLLNGQRLYQAQCASCHGATGAGDGALAGQLDPKPVDFTDGDRARQRSVMALYQVITQGVSGTSMPEFSKLDEADRWALAFYVGTLSYNEEVLQRGAQLYANDPASRAALPDLKTLATASEATLAQSLRPADAPALLAYTRANPQILSVPDGPSGTALARKQLKSSVEALQAGDLAGATQLALSAYLDGFEPLEAGLESRNKELLVDVERSMQLYRSAIARGDIGVALEHANRLDGLFVQVEAEFGSGRADEMATFVGALTILLREGVEALLIIVAMVAFLRKSNRPEALRYVHAGWISALLAGSATWLVATRVVSISGASREVTEGVSSLFAAVVLLSVGLWMHQKSSAGRWQAYLRERLSSALTGRTAWALFALAFIAVYREVFETVLFYSALATDGNDSALLAGLGIGMVLLTIIAVIFLKTSARMPISQFFALSSFLVAALAIVLAGKGISGLQEAGWLAATPVDGLRLPILGIFPTIQTNVAQALVLVAAVLGFGVNGVRARRLASI